MTRSPIFALVAIALMVTAGTADAQAARTRTGFPACATKEAIERVVEFANQGDRAAFDAYIANKRNGCVLLRGGIDIYIEDRTWGGLVKFRVEGDTTSFWTTPKALAE